MHSHPSSGGPPTSDHSSAMDVLQPYLQRVSDAWNSDARKWVVSFRSPLDCWNENPTYLGLELVFYVWTLLIFKHAWRHGGRYLILWCAALLHGFVTENIAYHIPDIDNFWHSQTMIMFIGRRLPLYIFLFYPCFHYITNIAATRLKLPLWALPFAVGLADVLLDVPYDVTGVNLVWWTWHDTDPNIFDRMYNVPWTSYMFHMTFASSFCILLNLSRRLLTGSNDMDKMSDSYFTEFVCMVVTGCLSMATAVIFQFIPVYHFFHDFYGVHTEVCVLLLVAIYVMLAWSGDRINNPDARPQQQASGKKRRSRFEFDELTLALLIMYGYYIFVAMVAAPETYRSTGLHQEVGDCDHVTYQQTVIGPLPKKTYLCASNHSEPYFSFDCVNGTLPPDGAKWYTICGVPVPNLMEYRVIVIGFSLFVLGLFYNYLHRSAAPSTAAKTMKQKRA